MAKFLNPAGFLSDQVKIPAESGHYPGGSKNKLDCCPETVNLYNTLAGQVFGYLALRRESIFCGV